MATSAPSSPEPFHFPTSGDPQGGEHVAAPKEDAPSESAVDHGVEESFPASDPVSVTVSRIDDDAAAPKAQGPGYGRALRTGLVAGSIAGVVAAGCLWARHLRAR